MEKRKLREQLKKYYEGTLTPREEQELIQYFNTEPVPEEFRVDNDIFTALGHEDMKDVPEGLTERMDRVIDNLESRSDSRTTSRRLFPLYASITGIAATVAILILSYFLFLYHPIKDTYSDPALAYEQTRKTLLYVSSTLNQGTGQMKYLAAATKPAAALQKLQSLSKPVEQLQKLDELNKGIQTLNDNAALDRTRNIFNKYLNINNKQK